VLRLREEVRGWRLEAEAKAKAKAKGEWQGEVFFATLLRQITLMENGILPKLGELR